MLSETLEAMRVAGATLDEFLAQYDVPSLPAHAPIPDLAPVSDALGRVGALLQQSPIPPDLSGPEKAEVDAYIDKVKRLKSTLEKLEPQLEQRRDAIRVVGDDRKQTTHAFVSCRVRSHRLGPEALATPIATPYPPELVGRGADSVAIGSSRCSSVCGWALPP